VFRQFYDPFKISRRNPRFDGCRIDLYDQESDKVELSWKYGNSDWIIIDYLPGSVSQDIDLNCDPAFFPESDTLSVQFRVFDGEAETIQDFPSSVLINHIPTLSLVSPEAPVVLLSVESMSYVLFTLAVHDLDGDWLNVEFDHDWGCGIDNDRAVCYFDWGKVNPEGGDNRFFRMGSMGC
jgi:hypothetical protein